MNKDDKIEQCMGRHGHLEDKLWSDDDFSIKPWGQAASSQPHSYESVGSAVYATGYERE